MKIEELEKENLFKQRKELLNIKEILKTEFIGIDYIIDEIIDLIEPWYLFSENQNRPTIINLWGMTGVGKSSLVKRIFELLKINNFFNFNLGDYTSNNETKLKDEFAEKIKGDNLKNSVFVFDEFQLGRSLGEQEEEIDRAGLRLIWDLIDSGKFQIIRETYHAYKINYYYLKLIELTKKYNIDVKYGTVIDGKEHFIKYIKEEREDSDIKDNDIKIIPSFLYWHLKEIYPENFLCDSDIDELIKTFDLKKSIKFLQETMERAIKPEEINFSKSIIFLIGNLDDAFKIAKNINPDVDADYLHEFTKKINIPDIKNALNKLFRPEQISRFGNNHLIYRSLSSQNYKDIIKLELSKIKKLFNEKYQIDLLFDNNINDIIYKEGVFPTQGVRPIFSTIIHLIETYFGKIINDIYIEDKEITKIYWDYLDKKYQINFINNYEILYSKEYDLSLKVENLRTVKIDDRQALVAVHEVGHILCCLYALNICPKMVFSKTANDDGGFTMFELPELYNKNLLLNNIITTYGGYAAEKIFFGKDEISIGSVSDIEQATELLLSYSKKFGFCNIGSMNNYDEIPLRFANRALDISYKCVSTFTDDIEKIMIDLSKKCLDKSMKIIENNKPLFLELLQYLLNNSKIDDVKIIEMLKKYDTELILKNKDNYHLYLEIVNKLIK
jgi:cell division protease FtsH